MRVKVDDQCCQGHSLCNVEAPEVFKLRDDDGHAYVDEPAVPTGLEDKVRRAAANCPEQAISFTE
ncbi:MAG TPA: ferredoxin [Acidimicrobiales bacterium]|jgi:ferredoxin|nr:ferredoxin [Acidimicrobiales bacterium]